MEKDLEILEDYIKTLKLTPEELLKNNEIIKFIEYKEIQAIENLINRVKELEDYKRITELTKIACCTSQNCEALNNAIREGLENNKLRERIEELEEINKNLLDNLNHSIRSSTIRERLGIEENIAKEQMLDYIDIIVAENARLEDIEDKKVQIEYQNVFNKGVKSVKDKIKEKIEDLRDVIQYSANPLAIDNSKYAIDILQEVLEEQEDK